MNNQSPQLVIYSHTDYIPVLRVQSDHVSKYPNKVLFINKNGMEDIGDIYNSFERVYWYDDKKPYASRVLEGMKSITSKYVLFVHDIDVILHMDEEVIQNITNIMDEESIDRVDIKHTPTDLINHRTINLPDGNVLWEQNDANYRYNVNPSIWKTDSFIEMLERFNYESYRDIESRDTQEFCLKYKIYKVLNTNGPVGCGWYDSNPFFKFLHISHGGQFLPVNEECKTPYGQSYEDIKEEVIKLFDKYSLGKQTIRA